ncbi:oligosaccharide flippase family protein [Thermodesulfobacteriota bacterium]
MHNNSKNQNHNSVLRKLLANTASIAASRVINRTTTFILYILIGRNFGAFEFGQMSLALTLFQSFQLLTTAGLQLLLTREIAKDKTKTGHYLLHSGLVVTGLSICSILGVSIFAVSMNYIKSTAIVIFLVSLSLLPYSLSILCDSVIQAWEKMHLIAISNLIANIFKIAAAAFLIVYHYNLNYIVFSLFISHMIGLIIKLLLMSKEIVISQVALDLRSCVDIIKSTMTFWGIRGTQAILSSINVILLSKFASEIEVGFYNAAKQLLVPVALVMESTMISVYPLMCKRFNFDFGNIKPILEKLLKLLMSFVLPVGIALYFTSDWLMIVIYDQVEFLQSAFALRFLTLVLVLRVFTQVLGRFLVAGLKEKITLRIVIVNLMVTIVLGPFLISQFQLLGALYTAAIVAMVNMGQHSLAIYNIGIKVNYFHILWQPALAGIIMVIFLLNVHFNQVLINASLAIIVYLFVFIILLIYDSGGISKFKVRVQLLLSKL